MVKWYKTKHTQQTTKYQSHNKGKKVKKGRALPESFVPIL